MRPPTGDEVALAEQLHAGPRWRAGHVEEGGSEHLVLVAAPDAVLRIARIACAAADLPRRVAVTEALAAVLPFALPVPLSPVWRDAGRAAVVQEYIGGRAHPFGSGDPERLRVLVRHLAAVDVAGLGVPLAPSSGPRGPWTDERRQLTLRATPPALAAAAIATLDAIARYDVPPGLVHGDLAGDNMRWVDGELAGVLDWDHASAADPAINIAHLSLWHGHEIAARIAPDRATADRAVVWAAALSLERVCDLAQRTDRPDAARLWRKVGPRLQRAAVVLRNPRH